MNPEAADSDLLKLMTTRPGDESLRLEYLKQLERDEDPRAAYVRLMLERRRLAFRLHEVESEIRSVIDLCSAEWLDVVDPLSVRAPLLGRFYGRPRPDAAPYVSPGGLVMPDTVVCVIEQFNIFHEIVAGTRGQVSEVCVADGAGVEFGEIMFRLSHLSKNGEFDWW